MCNEELMEGAEGHLGGGLSEDALGVAIWLGFWFIFMAGLEGRDQGISTAHLPSSITAGGLRVGWLVIGAETWA